MASVIVFLAYSFLMFQAGYQWCKWGRGADSATEPARKSGSTWDGMVGKI